MKKILLLVATVVFFGSSLVWSQGIQLEQPNTKIAERTFHKISSPQHKINCVPNALLNFFFKIEEMEMLGQKISILMDKDSSFKSRMKRLEPSINVSENLLKIQLKSKDINKWGFFSKVSSRFTFRELAKKVEQFCDGNLYLAPNQMQNEECYIYLSLFDHKIFAKRDKRLKHIKGDEGFKYCDEVEDKNDVDIERDSTIPNMQPTTRQ